MKRFLAIILAVLCVLPAFAFQSVSAAPNDWNTFWLTGHNTCAQEAGAALVTANEFNVINAWAWRYVCVFEPVEGKAGVYELTATFDHLAHGTADESVITDFTGSSVPDGGFIYHINVGNDYSANGGINYVNNSTNQALETAKSWEIGTKFEFINLNLESLVAPTLTPNLKWYESGYECTAKYRIYKEEARPASETVTIDGVHNDNAWIEHNWITVDGASGYWQKDFNDKSLSFKFQFRTDVNYLYGAAVIYNPPVAGSGNGSATNFRLWLNTDSSSVGATHYYDIFYNTSGGAGITPSVSGSEMIAALTTASSSVSFEFRVPLSEIGAANLEQIPYFISCSTNNGSEEPCLYYPKVYNASGIYSPKNSWYRANDGDLNALALRLNGFEYTLSETKDYYILSGAGTSASGDVVIPATHAGLPVKEIGRLAFHESLITSVSLPDSVTKIGQGAFAQCKSLSSVSLGNGVVEIGMMAFMGCESLENITLPATLTTIGNLAFSSCGLSSITIPKNIVKVGSNAFSFCESLESIYCGANSKPAEWSEIWKDNCEANVYWSEVTHTFETDWTANETHHWHACRDCDDVVEDKAPHVFGAESDTCIECGYKLKTDPPVNPPVDPEVKLGDVNDDGAIDQYDYILVKLHYFETRTLTDDEFTRADVNGDTKVDQFDYILIARHYFGTYVIG